MYNMLVRTRVPVQAVAGYWSLLAPAFRLALLCLFLSFYCYNYQFRIGLVGLISAYFIEKYKKLTTRSALVSLPPAGSASASSGAAGGSGAAGAVEHDTRFINESEQHPSDMSNVDRRVSSRYQQPIPHTPSTNAFGDRIRPTPSSTSGRVENRSGRGRLLAQDHSRSHTRADNGDISQDLVHHNHNLNHTAEYASVPLMGVLDQTGRRQGAQDLADGRPQESSALTPNSASVLKSGKRKRKSEVEVEQPKTKKKSTNGSTTSQHDISDSDVSSTNSSLWQQVYQGISAFVGTGSSDNAKRKRFDDNVEPQSKRPAKSSNPTLTEIKTSSAPPSSKRRHRDLSPSQQVPAKVVSESVAATPSPVRKHKVRRSHPEIEQESINENTVQAPVEEKLLPQSKYLQDLLTKRESSRSTALVVSGSSGGNNRNSSRPSLHRRTSTVSIVSVDIIYVC